MYTTTAHELIPTLTPSGSRACYRDSELFERYEQIINEKRLHWTSHHRLLKLLGAGGLLGQEQAERAGRDGLARGGCGEHAQGRGVDTAARLAEADQHDPRRGQLPERGRVEDLSVTTRELHAGRVRQELLSERLIELHQSFLLVEG